ncbi:MAG: restriction endonuclease [Acidobacteriia bacterium]|nr:restriction endonuclease [Terriglobia bacterium]
MSGDSQLAKRFVTAISKSGLSIYDKIEVGSDLWIPSPELEVLLNEGLRNTPLFGLPLRTRSKVVKEKICRILGYPIPSSFKKSHPRFLGQLFDTYIQKSNNLQVWNEELDPGRRYVIIRVSGNDRIERVKVVSGNALAKLDTTGTLTQKYQARLTTRSEPAELVTQQDTENLLACLLTHNPPTVFQPSPTDHPSASDLLPIGVVYERLSQLIGQGFSDIGSDQERNRGGQLHRLVCMKLGYLHYADDGSFPDIRNQLLEVKLQTSPTIDLGLVLPNSRDLLDVPNIRGMQIRHCDVRYALFYASTRSNFITLTHFYLTTGEAFFTRFTRFEGMVLNRKLQIPLPTGFFQ